MFIRRNAFSLIELIIVAAIIGILVGILVPAVQRVRESATTAQCWNNLHQIGISVHHYNETFGSFPQYTRSLDGGFVIKTIFIDLAPFLEENYNQGTTAFSTYLCPGRRGPEVGPKFDYGIAEFRMWFIDEFSNYPVVEVETAFDPVGVTNAPKAEDMKAGLSNILALAHKGNSPQFYSKNPTYQPGGLDYFGSGFYPDWFAMMGLNADMPWNDQTGWWHLNVARWPYGFFKDSVKGHELGAVSWFPQPATPCIYLLTSPHSAGMPCLFADGSVRTQAYTKNWSFNHPYRTTGQIVEASQHDLFIRNLWNRNGLEDEAGPTTIELGF